MFLGLSQVLLEGLLEFVRMGGLDHFRQRLGYGVFGEVGVLQLMLEQFAEIAAQRIVGATVVGGRRH